MVFFLSQILSTCPMSRSQVIFRRWCVCDSDEIMYYTITCSFVYSATVLGQFRPDCLLKSDMSPSSCRWRVSIGNLQGHTPWVLDYVPSLVGHVETNCIIQDHQISDSSQIFLGCSFRCTCLFQAAHVMLVREISATVHTVTMCVCVRHTPQNRPFAPRTPFCCQNITTSFKYICNIIMSLKT